MRSWRLSALCGLVCLAHATTAFGAVELPPNFRLEPVLAGLTDPVALAFTPDGRILIAERTTGSVRQVRNGELQAAPLCSVGVTTTGEAGLLGIAVHPRFRDNGFIYLYYTDLSSLKNKIARFSVTGNVCSAPTDIVPDLGAGAGFLRNGGGLGFGADGKLYAATGDVQLAANGQNAASLNGKVLRINDDGSVPADNPTPGSLVYAQGLRDGRSLGITSTGQVYASDRGSDAEAAHDELNAPAAGGNLGWSLETGPGGALDPPLASWLPTIGEQSLTAYAGANYPDQAADGVDNDFDAYGVDRYPGVARTDDNGVGTCAGSAVSGSACTSNANCPSRPSEIAFCELRDDAGEWCPGGVAAGDDTCGAVGAAGLDEPDETFRNNVFLTASNRIQRAVPQPANPAQLSKWETFFTSSAFGDCPTGWTGVATGPDGFVYALATNGGGVNGKLYRFVYDVAPGPREVSAPASPFPLRVERNAVAGQYDVYWEDLRDDAKQPRDNGTNPSLPVREFTVWKGTLGSFASHTPVVGLEATQGTIVNDALRKATVTSAAGENAYFLVSARSANLEGTLGSRTGGPRPGPAVTDLCNTIGFHDGPSWALWKCGRNFTLVDEFGQTRSLYEFRGQPVFLDLSAIWCAPCNSEANVVENLNSLFKDRGVRILTVLSDDSINSPSSPPGRPTPPECRNWGDRAAPNPDHTFPCWVDPDYAQAWPLYDKFGALPTNLILDTGMRVIYTEAGYDEVTIRARLSQLVGTDSCLH
ncbi:MAG TPA: PQQ-dependent sugar dehydrogenase [Candidatus Polarisedimenticolaceae bacterium]|nr:PQQ-dependent sugar dehydrogenase [Candidatus Polarisedimenticolaceae bacterium]